MFTPNELVVTFGGCYLCGAFGENRFNKWDRESADRQTDTSCDRDKLLIRSQL